MQFRSSNRGGRALFLFICIFLVALSLVGSSFFHHSRCGCTRFHVVELGNRHPDALNYHTRSLGLTALLLVDGDHEPRLCQDSNGCWRSGSLITRYHHQFARSASCRACVWQMRLAITWEASVLRGEVAATPSTPNHKAALTTRSRLCGGPQLHWLGWVQKAGARRSRGRYTGS